MAVRGGNEVESKDVGGNESVPVAMPASLLQPVAMEGVDTAGFHLKLQSNSEGAAGKASKAGDERDKIAKLTVDALVDFWHEMANPNMVVARWVTDKKWPAASASPAEKAWIGVRKAFEGMPTSQRKSSHQVEHVLDMVEKAAVVAMSALQAAKDAYTKSPKSTADKKTNLKANGGVGTLAMYIIRQSGQDVVDLKQYARDVANEAKASNKIKRFLKRNSAKQVKNKAYDAKWLALPTAKYSEELVATAKTPETGRIGNKGDGREAAAKKTRKAKSECDGRMAAAVQEILDKCNWKKPTGLDYTKQNVFKHTCKELKASFCTEKTGLRTQRFCKGGIRKKLSGSKNCVVPAEQAAKYCLKILKGKDVPKAWTWAKGNGIQELKSSRNCAK